MTSARDVTARNLGLVFLFLAFAVYGGHLYTGDGEAYFIVALKCLLFESPTLPAYLSGFATEGVGGALFAKFGLGLSLLAMPFLAVSLLVGGLVPGLVLGGGQLRAVALLVGPVAGSVGIICLYLFQRHLGFDRKPSVVSTLFCALNGLMLVYSRFLLPELSLSVLFLVIVWGLFIDTTRGDWMIGWGSAMAILLRYDAVVFVAPILLYRWYRHRRTVPLAFPLAVSLGLIGTYNSVRFGSPLSVGMGSSSVETFSTPILLGLYGQFFAVGNGLFIYLPYLGVLGLLSVWHAGKKTYTNKRVLVVLLASAFFVCLHAKWYSWMGGWSWGPRRMIPLVLLMHVPLGYIWSDFSHSLRRLFVGLGVVSLLLNLPGLLTDFNDYYKGTFYKVDVMFNPVNAQVVQQARGMWDGSFPIDVFWIWYFGVWGWVPLVLLLGVSVGVLWLELSKVKKGRSSRSAVPSVK